MDNKIFNWCGYEWQTQECWGNLHPDRPWTWDDPGCVKVNNNNELELTIDLNPKRIIIDGREYNPDYGMGLVSTTANNPKFKYGHYEWIVKMPKGKHLWPALWMWSWDSWPPEIDVAEGWTNGCGGYYKFPCKTDITTNVHYRWSNEEIRNIGSKPVPLMTKAPTDNFVRYEMIWLPDELQFWYDNVKVRVVDDPVLMSYINQNTQGGMNIIMNLHPMEKYHEGELKNPMVIKYFKYTDANVW